MPLVLVTALLDVHDESTLDDIALIELDSHIALLSICGDEAERRAMKDTGVWMPSWMGAGRWRPRRGEFRWESCGAENQDSDGSQEAQDYR
jgi:hypothetical protein